MRNNRNLGVAILAAAASSLLTVALVAGTPAQGAATISAAAACVNKSTGAVRIASRCKANEAKSTLATKTYVDNKVSTRAPRYVDVRSIPAQSTARTATATEPLDVALLAASSMQTVATHYVVPNLTGSVSGAPEIVYTAPDCPSTAPILLQQLIYSTNYDVIDKRVLKNSDGSDASYSSYPGSVSFSNNLDALMPAAFYPKDGDVDLYLVSVCMPIPVD